MFKYTRVGGNEVIIDQFTNVIPLDSGNVDFVYSDKVTSNAMVSSIVSCNELAAEQLVTLKAEVAEISGVKKVPLPGDELLRKCDGCGSLQFNILFVYWSKARLIPLRNASLFFIIKRFNN